MATLRRPEEPEGNLHVVQLTTVDHEIRNCDGFCQSVAEGVSSSSALPTPAGPLARTHTVGGEETFVKLADPDTDALRQACTLANPSLFAAGCAAPICERDIIGEETAYDGAALRFTEELAHVDRDGGLATYYDAVVTHRSAGDQQDGAALWSQLAAPHGWPHAIVDTPTCDALRNKHRLVDRRSWDELVSLSASVHSIDGRLRLVVCGEPEAVVQRCESMHSAELAELTHEDASPTLAAHIALAASDGAAAAVPMLSGTLSIDGTTGFQKLNAAQQDFLGITAKAMAEPGDEEVLAGTQRIVRSYGQRWLTPPLPGMLQDVGEAPTGADLRTLSEKQVKEYARDFGRTFGKHVIGVVGGDMPETMRSIEDLCELGTEEEEREAIAVMDDEAKRGALICAVRKLLQANGEELGPDELEACCKRVLYNLTVTPAIDLALANDCPPALFQARFVLLAGGSPLQLRVVTATYVGGPVAGDQPQVMHTPFVVRMMTPNLLEAEVDGDESTPVGGVLSYTTAFTCDPKTESLLDKEMNWYTAAVSNGDWNGFSTDCWYDSTLTISSLLEASPSAHQIVTVQKADLANSLATLKETRDLTGAGALVKENLKSLEMNKEGVRAGMKVMQEVADQAKTVRAAGKTPDGDEKSPDTAQAAADPFEVALATAMALQAASEGAGGGGKMVIPEGVPPTTSGGEGDESTAAVVASIDLDPERLAYEQAAMLAGQCSVDADASPPASPQSPSPTHSPQAAASGSPQAVSTSLDLHGLCFLGHIAVGGRPASSVARVVHER